MDRCEVVVCVFVGTLQNGNWPSGWSAARDWSMSAVGILAAAVLGIACFSIWIRRRKDAGQLRASEPRAGLKEETGVGGAESHPDAISPDNGPEPAEIHPEGAAFSINSGDRKTVPGTVDVPRTLEDSLPDEALASCGVADPALLETVGGLSAGDAEDATVLADSADGRDQSARDRGMIDIFSDNLNKVDDVIDSEPAEETSGETGACHDELVTDQEAAGIDDGGGEAARELGREQETDSQREEELTGGILGGAAVPPDAPADPGRPGENAVPVEENSCPRVPEAASGSPKPDDTAFPKSAGDTPVEEVLTSADMEDVADPGATVAAVAPERGREPDARGSQTGRDLTGGIVGDAAVPLVDSAVNLDQSGGNAVTNEEDASPDVGSPESKADGDTSLPGDAAATGETPTLDFGRELPDGGKEAGAPEVGAATAEDSVSPEKEVSSDRRRPQFADQDLESGLPKSDDAEPPGDVANVEPGDASETHDLGAESLPQERLGGASPQEPGASSGGRGPAASKRTDQPAAEYRDRRGQGGKPGTPRTQIATGAARPAPLELRLLLNERRKQLELSIVLKRPEDYPDQLVFADGLSVSAYDDSRYDDLQITVTAEMLDGHIGFRSEDNYQWARRKRSVHVFAEVPGERGMMTCGAVRTGGTFSILCKSSDEREVFAAATAVESPKPDRYECWLGLPEGWSLLGHFRPRRASPTSLATAFSVLDPGQAVDVSLSGGIEVRRLQFAQGHPPTIRIEPLSEGAEVMIDGEIAVLQESGWQAPGWDTPGDHFVDVNPGPMRKYTILEDPAVSEAWAFWDAHQARFCEDAPWGSAQICGGAIRGPSGEAVIAAKTRRVLVALGAENTVKKLTPRPVASVSVAQISVPPAYLVSATGFRRKHGSVIWLGSLPKRAKSTDQDWAREIHEARSRRWPLERADGTGKRAWLNAVRRARNLRKKLR